MIETRSNEMKIEREKGYVWCLVGMSMRSAIWNQFWDPKWSRLENLVRMLLKIGYRGA